jgi:uncharacterized protein YodC (DUF2158 family)
MTTFKSGDLVVLKSGGPTMTVDTVNTDIFDDDKITGILCVWFVGEKLERVRFDYRAIEPVSVEPVSVEPAPVEPGPLEKLSPATREAPSQEPTGDYQAVLDEMVDAMNPPTEDGNPSSRAAPKKPKPARARKGGTLSASTVIAGVGSSPNG